MEVHHVLRCDVEPIAGCRPEVPAPQNRQHLLIDTIADSLRELHIADIALRVNGDFDDDIAFDARRQLRAGDRGIGKNLQVARVSPQAR